MRIITFLLLLATGLGMALPGFWLASLGGSLYYAVAGMWVFNMAFSALWLRYFEFGPVEWAWRSLTYWQRQPMRIRSGALQVPEH